MPKRPVFKDPTEKKVKKPKASKRESAARAVPTLPELHPSQRALADRATAALGATGATLVVGKHDEPGLGKTRPTGAVVRAWLETQAASGVTAVALFVAKNAKLAKEQAGALGAHPTDSPFHAYDTTKVAADLAVHKMASLVLTRAMLFKLLKVEEAVSPRSSLSLLVRDLGAGAVLVVVDEAHELYKSPAKVPASMAVARAALQTEGVGLTVLGVTATPDFHLKACREGACTLFNLSEPPDAIEYTADEHAALCTELKPLPPAPDEWKTVDLGSPVGNPMCDRLLEEVKSLVVDLFMAAQTGDDAKIAVRGALKAKLADLCAALVHGADGGALVQLLKDPVPVRVVAGGAVDAATFAPGKQAALVAHKSASAEAWHHEAMAAAARKGETALKDALRVFHLGKGTISEEGGACKAMLAAFRAQEATAVGIVSKAQHSGHNDFSKLATTVVAVGATWTPSELRQLFYRVGRMGTPLDDGDVVPVAYTAVHLDCEWARKVAKIADHAAGVRTTALPKDVATALAPLKERLGHEYAEIEVNAKKLLAADAFMKTSGRLALKYLAAEAAYNRGERPAVSAVTPRASNSSEEEDSDASD